MVTKITNESIVAALPEAARINSRITELRSEINDRRSELEKLDRMSVELARVSCVRNGVAISVSEHYVSAVCWEIRSAGAYTTTYASVAFNGFEPLKTYCV